MYKKICLTIHPRNFGSDVSVARTLFRGGGGRESGVSPSWGGVCYIFLAGNRARNGVTLPSRSKTCLTVGNLYLTIS